MSVQPLVRFNGRRAAAYLVAIGTLMAPVACTGENIFPTGVAGVGGNEAIIPEVEITEPAADAALAVGDSVKVTATFVSSNGVNQVTISGSFPNGIVAYTQQVVSYVGATDTTVTRYLQASGIGTGSARIIVQARDILGNTGADTVSVEIS